MPLQVVLGDDLDDMTAPRIFIYPDEPPDPWTIHHWVDNPNLRPSLVGDIGPQKVAPPGTKYPAGDRTAPPINAKLADHLREALLNLLPASPKPKLSSSSSSPNTKESKNVNVKAAANPAADVAPPDEAASSESNPVPDPADAKHDEHDGSNLDRLGPVDAKHDEHDDSNLDRLGPADAEHDEPGHVPDYGEGDIRDIRDLGDGGVSPSKSMPPASESECIVVSDEGPKKTQIVPPPPKKGRHQRKLGVCVPPPPHKAKGDTAGNGDTGGTGDGDYAGDGTDGIGKNHGAGDWSWKAFSYGDWDAWNDVYDWDASWDDVYDWDASWDDGYDWDASWDDGHDWDWDAWGDGYDWDAWDDGYDWDASWDYGYDWAALGCMDDMDVTVIDDGPSGDVDDWHATPGRWMKDKYATKLGSVSAGESGVWIQVPLPKRPRPPSTEPPAHLQKSSRFNLTMKPEPSMEPEPLKPEPMEKSSSRIKLTMEPMKPKKRNGT